VLRQPDIYTYAGGGEMGAAAGQPDIHGARGLETRVEKKGVVGF